MSSPSSIDVARLLRPVEGENPAGLSLRHTRTHGDAYDQLKEARRAAARDEKLANRPVLAPWTAVLDLSPGLIETQSKDLEIAAYLTESLVRRDGFAGLKTGFELMRQMIEQYWDGLYPIPDPEDVGESPVATRLAPLRGLNGDDRAGTLVLPINWVALVGSDTGPGRLLIDDAKTLEMIDKPDERQARVEQGSMTLEAVQKIADTTPAALFQKRLADLDACSAEFDALSVLVTAKCDVTNGEVEPPATTHIRAALDGCRDALTSLAGDKLKSADAAPGDKAAGDLIDEPEHDQPKGPPVKNGPINSKREAYARLEEVISFLRQEKHSLVVPLLEKARRWGDMDVSQVLTEIIEDSGSRTSAFKLAGIAEKKDE